MKEEVVQYNVRLNLSNPKHLEIFEKLNDLNLDIHKSKNNFIVIMDAPNNEERGCKQYILTADGIKYVKEYVPKLEDTKPKKLTRKPKTTIQESRYAPLNADCLKPEKYVDVCSLGKFLDQMIMVMYIVTKENLGEWFTTEDVQYLLTKILGIPATKDQVNGVYKRNKKWFDTQKDTNNPKANAYRLLDGGKKHAESLLTK